MEARPAQTGLTPLDTPCHACAPRASTRPGQQLCWGSHQAHGQGLPVRVLRKLPKDILQGWRAVGAPLGIQTELAPGPRTAACEHMHTGWPGQGAWVSGQGVSHITSPLSPGTCRVLPSSSGWHGHGCQRTPLMPGIPHLPPSHLHIPLIMELIGTGAEMGQVTVSQLLLQGIQEATRSGPVWAL